MLFVQLFIRVIEQILKYSEKESKKWEGEREEKNITELFL